MARERKSGDAGRQGTGQDNGQGTGQGTGQGPRALRGSVTGPARRTAKGAGMGQEKATGQSTAQGTAQGAHPGRRKRGFERASGLVAGRVRTAGEARGFAVARLLTHWPEIVGQEIAAVARPVSVRYGRHGGLGATLTVLTTGAQAPLLQMQEPRLREKVNACYGYAAISRIRITQTAPTGFAEGQAAFAPAPPAERRPDPAVEARAADLAAPVGDDGLRAALARLGTHVLARVGPDATETPTE